MYPNSHPNPYLVHYNIKGIACHLGHTPMVSKVRKNESGSQSVSSVIFIPQYIKPWSSQGQWNLSDIHSPVHETLVL